MKKTILFILGINCYLLANAVTSPMGWVYFYDKDNNDLQLVLTATCTLQNICPQRIGVGQQQANFVDTMTITDSEILNQQWNTRDIFSSIPKNCQTITAPQTITFSVDSAGNTTVTCTKQKSKI